MKFRHCLSTGRCSLGTKAIQRRVHAGPIVVVTDVVPVLLLELLAVQMKVFT